MVGTWHCQAQTRATCLFGEQFPEGDLPAFWVGQPAEVERLDADGNGTGEFVFPWKVGNALQANTGGYFPVPDEPIGNTFAMADDDASPCDCALTDLSLFSPFIDLTTATAPAVTYRVYHDGRPFNGQASLWASPDGNAWTMIEHIPPVLGAWQWHTADLAAFAGGNVQLRFRYDDGGQWASGIAVDDVCVFDRLAHDIALTDAWLGDAMASAFNTSERSLGYSRMPMEQQTSLWLSARIRNNGTDSAMAVRVEAIISVNGGSQTTITSTVAEALAPLRDTLVAWNSGFLAGEAGPVTLHLTASAFNPDEETSDNSRDLEFAVTSADEGNNAMALDNDLASSVCGSDSGFSAGCRYEMIGGGSVIHGISVRFGAGTQAGSRIHALLMDGTFDLLSSSANYVVSDDDLMLSFSGGSVYIPLDSAVTMDDPGDVIALVQCLPDSGVMRLTCGGGVPQGAAFVIDAQDFLISYPATAPIVRIHLSEPVTGIPQALPASAGGLAISPNPVHGLATVRTRPAPTSSATLLVLDAQGREVATSRLPAGKASTELDTDGWPAGVYLVRVSAGSIVQSGRLVVAP